MDCLADVNCTQLNVTNAKLNSTAVTYDTHVNISCYTGFQLDVEKAWTVTRCQADKKWSVLPVSCTREEYILTDV